jgi:diacylglycerol O-acyltransferase
MPVTRFLARLIRKRGGKIGLLGNVAVSNVPGPREPFYVGPMEVVNWFSTGQIFDGTSVNMTLWSYCGKANLCILTDREVLPDGWVLYEYFREEVSVLSSLADRPTAIKACS